MQGVTSQPASQNDDVDAARANALAATLGITERFDAGSILPPFFHQVYFWDARPAEELGRDGHPRVGGLIPNMGLPRRMWAGGRLQFLAPLRAGAMAEKTSHLASVEHKQGRSGPFALVTLRHEIRQGGALCLTEHQDLVYLPDAGSGGNRPTPIAETRDADSCHERGFGSTMLFRYSALTFNGHKIHYDLDYATGVEGYDGLVVHGPLLAQLLMLKAEQELGPLAAFSFRATAPLMHHERAQICRKGNALWVVGPKNRLCMKATAEVRLE